MSRQKRFSRVQAIMKWRNFEICSRKNEFTWNQRRNHFSWLKKGKKRKFCFTIEFSENEWNERYFLRRKYFVKIQVFHFFVKAILKTIIMKIKLFLIKHKYVKSQFHKSSNFFSNLMTCHSIHFTKKVNTQQAVTLFDFYSLTMILAFLAIFWCEKSVYSIFIRIKVSCMREKPCLWISWVNIVLLQKCYNH